jgi:hypothetical protein
VEQAVNTRFLEVTDLSITPQSPAASGLARRLAVEPWRATRPYATAGTLYAITLATVSLLFERSDYYHLSISTFLILSLVFAWPIVLVVNLVAAGTRASRWGIILGYTALFGATGLLDRSLAALWPIFNLPATILILLSLNRRVRAVGPLVVTFLLVAIGGIFIAAMFAMAAATWSRRVSAIIAAAALLIVVALAWGALFWIRRRYDAKRISDESLTVAALWLSFGWGHLMAAMFLQLDPRGFATMGAFAVYAITLRISRPSVKNAPVGLRLLLLRSFSIGRRAERLFSAVEKHWRRVGSIEMIAGDLACALLSHMSFSTSPSANSRGTSLIQRRPWIGAREMDTRPDRDGRFRVNDFFKPR